ncbi:MAG: AI-2E family transporter [Odoribacter sp.]|nr:AI-2E family transporter [Odoribacter sp.]
MTSSRPYTFDRVVRMIIGTLLIIGAVWLINILKNVLLPFCLACLIAYILEPLVEYTRKLLRLKGRGLAIFITLFEVTLIISMLIYFFVPSVMKEIDQLGEMIKAGSEGSLRVPFIPESFHTFFTNNINYDNFIRLLEEGHLQTFMAKGSSLISDTITLLLHTLEWLLTFIYVIFVLLDYKHLMKGFRLLVPPKFRPVAYKVGDDIKFSMNRYFRGQALIALCAAVFYCIGFSIVGIPLAIVLGMLVGVLYLIPYFQYVTLIPVAIVCYISSMTGAVEFWPELCKCGLVYLISQCVCDYVLTPKIMGKAMGLNPAIILLSLSVWGTLLGLIGMIIALPLTTLILSYYQEYVINGSDDTPALKREASSEFDQITRSK